MFYRFKNQRPRRASRYISGPYMVRTMRSAAGMRYAVVTIPPCGVAEVRATFGSEDAARLDASVRNRNAVRNAIAKVN